MYMKREVEVRLSDQAKTILQATEFSEEEVIDYVTKDGFSIGGREVIGFLESHQ